MTDRDDDFAYADVWFDLIRALALAALVAALGITAWLILGMETVK